VYFYLIPGLLKSECKQQVKRASHSEHVIRWSV